MSEIEKSLGTRQSQILGVGSYLPERVVTNAELCARIDSTDEWIRTRTGISTRHWAGPDETVADMALTAARSALASAGIRADEVSCVIVATFTHLMQTPAAATEVAHRLGVGPAPAFDISAGCAGFVYGVTLASDMVRGGASYVLVIGAERMTDLLDLDDRSTAFLFGDGAGAVVIGPSDDVGIGPVVWGSDGSQADAIAQTAPWNALRDDPTLRWPALGQDGRRVFRWAVYEMAKVATEVLQRAGVAPADLDAFIPHQANARIIDALAKRLELPAHVAVARDVVTAGNTSGASIPLAMDRMLATGQAKSGDVALLLGYGAGLCYAGTVVRLP